MSVEEQNLEECKKPLKRSLLWISHDLQHAAMGSSPELKRKLIEAEMSISDQTDNQSIMDLIDQVMKEEKQISVVRNKK